MGKPAKPDKLPEDATACLDVLWRTDPPPKPPKEGA